ncbi:unnamed protein product [Boreogadus saida]
MTTPPAQPPKPEGFGSSRKRPLLFYPSNTLENKASPTQLNQRVHQVNGGLPGPPGRLRGRTSRPRDARSPPTATRGAVGQSVRRGAHDGYHYGRRFPWDGGFVRRILI